MKNMRIILATVAMVLVVVMPGCKSRKKPITPTTVPTTTAPDVPPPPPMPTDTSTSVTPPDDFVRETPVQEEQFPNDIEAADKYAHSKGYIRDAFYNYDEATLDEAAQGALSASANWLKSAQGSSFNLLIEGHCDERGTEQYNLALGDRRANSAKDYLVTLGVDASRIRTVSYGEERPFEEGHDDSSWGQNRRAHLVLVR